MFTDDTKIKTPNGEKIIRHIKLGDEVYRADNTIGKVIEVKPQAYKPTYAVVCGGKSALYTTLSQAVMTSDERFVEVGMLRMGNLLKSVGKISAIAESGDRKCYGLVIDGDNTYIANGFIVKGEYLYCVKE